MSFNILVVDATMTQSLFFFAVDRSNLWPIEQATELEQLQPRIFSPCLALVTFTAFVLLLLHCNGRVINCGFY